MKYLILILISVIVIYGAYMLLCALLAKIGKRELEHSGVASEEDDSIHIYASAESLEYYIRCALMSSNLGKTQVVVHIRKNDPNRADMIDIAERMSRGHRNLTYRIT